MEDRLTVEMVRDVCEEHNFLLKFMSYLEPNANCGCAVGAALVLRAGSIEEADVILKASEALPGDSLTRIHELTDFDTSYTRGLDHGFEGAEHYDVDETVRSKMEPDYIDSYEIEDPDRYHQGLIDGHAIAVAAFRGEIPHVGSLLRSNYNFPPLWFRMREAQESGRLAELQVNA
jgi:hypothetical protein